MRRVLFVDDDPNVLNGLRRALHRERSRWDMVFVACPHVALQRLHAEPFDVIVSDLHMTAMSGLDLLSTVTVRHPQVSCLLLSGSADLRAAAAVAGRVLAKPCDPVVLCRAITTALATKESNG